MNFADSLKRFRKERELTQQQVADVLGIHKQAYQRYESGKVVPSVEVLINIANAFDVDANYLLGLVKVDSFSIKEIGYNDGELLVKFRDGSLYRYQNVSEEIYNKFLAATSKGMFFVDNIQYRYSCQLITDNAENI